MKFEAVVKQVSDIRWIAGVKHVKEHDDLDRTFDSLPYVLDKIVSIKDDSRMDILYTSREKAVEAAKRHAAAKSERDRYARAIWETVE